MKYNHAMYSHELMVLARDVRGRLGVSSQEWLDLPPKDRLDLIRSLAKQMQRWDLIRYIDNNTGAC